MGSQITREGSGVRVRVSPRGIAGVQIVNGDLIVTFTDGTTQNAGSVGTGGSTPTPTPAPSFTTQPTISPTSGTAGATTFTATAGVVTNETTRTRAWLLNGTSISTGLTASPQAAGTLTYQEFSTGPGGNSSSVIRSATVAAAPTPTPSPTPTPTGPFKLKTVTLSQEASDTPTNAAFGFLTQYDANLPDSGYMGFGMKLERATNSGFTSGYTTETVTIQTPALEEGATLDYPTITKGLGNGTYYYRASIVPPNGNTTYTAADPSNVITVTIAVSTTSGFDASTGGTDYALSNNGKRATRTGPDSTKGLIRGYGVVSSGAARTFECSPVFFAGGAVGIGVTTAAERLGDWMTNTDRFSYVPYPAGIAEFINGAYQNSQAGIGEGGTVAITWNPVTGVVTVNAAGSSANYNLTPGLAMLPFIAAEKQGAIADINLTGPFVVNVGATPWLP